MALASDMARGMHRRRADGVIVAAQLVSREDRDRLCSLTSALVSMAWPGQYVTGNVVGIRG